MVLLPTAAEVQMLTGKSESRARVLLMARNCSMRVITAQDADEVRVNNSINDRVNLVIEAGRVKKAYFG